MDGGLVWRYQVIRPGFGWKQDGYLFTPDGTRNKTDKARMGIIKPVLCGEISIQGDTVLALLKTDPHVTQSN